MNQAGPRLQVQEEHVAGAPLAARLPSAGSYDEGGASPHSHKFRGAIAVLFALALASLIVAFLLTAFGGARTQAGSDWSLFKPADGGLQGAQEIADYVAPYYRASPAVQLTVVNTMNLSDPNNPIQLVIPNQSAANGYATIPSVSTVAFQLCGLGSHDCSVGTGKPSAARLLLLRREALELALYTFKYVGGVHNVVAILPPAPAGSPSRLSRTSPIGTSTRSSKAATVEAAVAFDRKELQPWLNRPLRSILPEDLPPTVSQMQSAPEAELVSLITAHGLFTAQTEQAQDGSKLIVLSPQTPQ